MDLNRTSIFQSPLGFLDLHTMLLDEYQERLFVGGRDLVYSLNLERISDNYREVWKQQLFEEVMKEEDCIARVFPDIFSLHLPLSNFERLLN